MDSNKNIIAAISLSAAIIVLWALFFSPSPEDREKIKQKRIDSVKSLDAPEIENSETNNLLSRKEALNKDKRIEYGLIKGFFKGTKRVLSCHPIKFLGGGEGFEPVKKNKN